MRYKLFGKSGLRVSELCLGTMTFGEDWGWGASKAESRKIFDAFCEAGGNFIDTANCYTNGTSEKFTGEFIAAERDRFVLSTKYTQSTKMGEVNACGNHRKNLVRSLEDSLTRLKTDRLDLYWVHMWDFMTPVEEVMRALDDMVRAGKILYAGISDTPAWIVSQANTLAALRGWTPFAGLQIEYSLIERTAERELLPMAAALDIAVTAWSPLGSGILTGKYGRSSTTNAPEPKRLTTGLGDFRGVLNDRNSFITDEVCKIAGRTGRAPSQVALNWLRAQKGVVLPILGSRTALQMKENLGCLDFELDEKDLMQLGEISKIDLGFPHDFLANGSIREFVFGGTLPSIENHRT